MNGYMKDETEGFEEGFEQVAFELPPPGLSKEGGLEWCRQKCLSVPGCRSISFRREKRCAMYGVDPVRADISYSTADYRYHNYSWTDKISCFPNKATSCEFRGRILGEKIKGFSKDDKPAQSKAACRSACKEQEDCKSFSYRALAWPSTDSELSASCLLFTNSNLKREDVRCSGEMVLSLPGKVLNKCNREGEYISESMSCEGRKRIIEIGSHIVNAGAHLAARVAFGATKGCEIKGRARSSGGDAGGQDYSIEECRNACLRHGHCQSISYRSDTRECLISKRKEEIIFGGSDDADMFVTEDLKCVKENAEEGEFASALMDGDDDEAGIAGQ